MAKRLTFLIFSILFISFFCVSQESEKSQASEQTKVETDETKIFLDKTTSETSVINQPQFSFFGSLWKFILMLVIVCGFAYIVLKMLKKANTISFNDDPHLKVVSSLKLAPNKILYIIALKQTAFLIAVTEKTISLISKIEDPELVDTLILSTNTQSGEQQSFAQMLSSLFIKKSQVKTETTTTINQNKNGTNQSDKLTDDFLSEMRNRLNNAKQSENQNSGDV